MASSTISTGSNGRERATSASIPARSLGTAQRSPEGRTATTHSAFATSIPTTTGSDGIVKPFRDGRDARAQPPNMRGVPRPTVRALRAGRVTLKLSCGLDDSRPTELSPADVRFIGFTLSTATRILKIQRRIEGSFVGNIRALVRHPWGVAAPRT